MTILRIVEFLLSTLILLVSGTIWILSVRTKSPLAWDAHDWALVVLVWALFPIVVFVGAYKHARLKQTKGFFILFAGSFGMCAAALYLFVLIGANWGIPDWIAWLSLTPSFLALLLLLTAIFVLYFEMNKKIPTSDDRPDVLH